MSAHAPTAIVAGTGFGCRVQVPALRAAGFRVEGLVGTELARTQERADVNGVPHAFTNLDEAITRTGATVVAIATPPNTHGRLALEAIARNCHVLCEKPFAANLAEARAMLQAAERAGVVHLLGHEFRFAAERATLARAVASGAIGTPRLATFTLFIPYLVNPDIDMPPWWFDLEAGGGWLGANGSHLVDWIRTVLGDIDSLSAALPRLSAHEGADDSFVFRLETKNGAAGIVQQSASSWGPPVDIVRVMGSEGTAWVDGTTVKVADRNGERVVPVADDLELPVMPPVGRDPRYETEKWRRLIQTELQPYLRLCQGFRTLIEGGSPSKSVPLATFADGVAVMAVLDAVRKSAATGGATVKVG